MVQGTLKVRGRTIPTSKSPPPCVAPGRSQYTAPVPQREPAPTRQYPFTHSEMASFDPEQQTAAPGAASSSRTEVGSRPSSAERRWLSDPRGRGSYSVSVRGRSSSRAGPRPVAKSVAKALCEHHTRQASHDQVVSPKRSQPKGRGRRKKFPRKRGSSSSSERRGSSSLKSNHSPVTSTSSGSSGLDICETEIVRTFLRSTPMDNETAAVVLAVATDKNFSNHMALTRHFDHLRHEQFIADTSPTVAFPKTATAGACPSSGGGDMSPPRARTPLLRSLKCVSRTPLTK